MKKNGFTLIELMIAITIGILLVGAAGVALNDFNERQKVEAVFQEVIADLRLARNYAITSQLPNGGNRTLVTIDNNGILIIKTQDINNNDVGSTILRKDVAPGNVVISADNTIRFSIFDGRSIDGVVNIGVSGDDLVKNIRVDESGLIYEQ